MRMIYDSYHIKNGKDIDEQEKLCDCCDEMAKCASISSIGHVVSVICKSCLDKISFEFYSEQEKRDIIIDKILNNE